MRTDSGRKCASLVSIILRRVKPRNGKLTRSPDTGIMPERRKRPVLTITSIELREIRLPLIDFFETSFGRTTERRIVLVHVVDQDGADGWGECTAGEGPFYSDEWTDTAWATLQEFLAPMVLGTPARFQLYGLGPTPTCHEAPEARSTTDTLSRLKFAT